MLYNTLKYFLSYSLLLLLFGCNNPSFPLPSNESVVFSLTAEINGNLKTWEAGVDNQYMYTYTSTDSNNLTLFQGTLGEVGCQFCPNSLNFDFVQAAGSNLIEDLFNGQAINYKNILVPQIIEGYEVYFDAKVYGNPPFTFDWDFGDASSVVHSTSNNIQHHYNDAGVYNVCVQITAANGIQSHFCKKISTDNLMTCSGSFRVFPLGSNFPNAYLLQAYPAGVPPFSYQWNIHFDSLSTINSVASSPIITVNQGVMPNIHMILTDGNNCNCTLTQDINFQQSDSLYTNFFDYSSMPEITLGVAQDYYSTLNIQYIDDNGKVFTSALKEQPSTSYLNILNVADFEMNEIGMPTKKVSIEFGCRLFNIDGSYIDVNNGYGTIGIAY